MVLYFCQFNKLAKICHQQVTLLFLCENLGFFRKLNIFPYICLLVTLPVSWILFLSSSSPVGLKKWTTLVESRAQSSPYICLQEWWMWAGAVHLAEILVAILWYLEDFFHFGGFKIFFHGQFFSQLGEVSSPFQRFNIFLLV